MSSSRNLLGITVALAFVVGLLHGSRMLLPAYLANVGGYTVVSIGTILSGLVILSILLDPFVVFALGYLWGRRANVPDAYLGFGARLFAAAFVGFALGYAAILASLPDPMGSVVVRTAMVSAVAGVGTAANVALAALAAGALAHFRGRYRPDPAQTDDSSAPDVRS